MAARAGGQTKMPSDRTKDSQREEREREKKKKGMERKRTEEMAGL